MRRTSGARPLGARATPWSGGHGFLGAGVWRGPRFGGLCCFFPPLAWFMLPIVALLPQIVINCEARKGR